MNALQFRLEVFEEFFQLNHIDRSQRHTVSGKFRYSCDEILQTLDEQGGKEKAKLMTQIYLQAIDERWQNCGVCTQRVDMGTINFPKKNRCPNCDRPLCHKISCAHWTVVNGVEQLQGCIHKDCKGPEIVELSD